tara:strand:+ start:131 stop:709 length:579 start_codon:yes stop_codon:yes gene_type:complete
MAKKKGYRPKGPIQILAAIGLVIAILWTAKVLFQFGSAGYKEVTSSKSNYKIITLTKCYITDLQETNGKEVYSYKNWKEQTLDKRIEYENKLYTLDTVTGVITQTTVFKDTHLKRMRENNLFLKKHTKVIFKIVDLGGNVATAEDTDLGKWFKKNTIDVDFKTNQVYRYSEADWGSGDLFKTATTEQCQRQK